MHSLHKTCIKRKSHNQLIEQFCYGTWHNNIYAWCVCLLSITKLDMSLKFSRYLFIDTATSYCRLYCATVFQTSSVQNGDHEASASRCHNVSLWSLFTRKWYYGICRHSFELPQSKSLNFYGRRNYIYLCLLRLSRCN